MTADVLITHSVEEAVYLGTRTLVMSPRPGRFVADVATTFSRTRDAGESRAIKSSREFVETREAVLSHIWAASS